ncbi:MAG TPA: galactose oxidase-like domain-containing protein [Euzebyales bacterium]
MTAAPAGAAAPLRDVVDEDGPSGPVVEGAEDGAALTRAMDVTGDPRAHIDGVWTDPVQWPLSAIHGIVLPDGTVMTYGTDENGRNSKGFTYDVWDPTKGMGASSHTTLPVGTSTNLFCSAQTVLPWNGQVLLTGGEEYGFPGGTENDAVDDVNLFDPASRTVTRLADSMSRARWYPTVTTMPNGEVLVHGGRDDKPDATPATMPEAYHPTNGWRRLTGATSSDVYGSGRWFYPRSWVAPNGRVFIVTKGDRGMWSLNPSGSGSMTRLGTYPGSTTNNTTPAAMFDIGRILLTKAGGQASVIDINGASPRVTPTASLGSYRSWADATVLPDGQVLVTGGASQTQRLAYAVRAAELWDPATGTWHRGAAAARARLYHSSAVLLPDATVLTAGGGPPGPVVNLNAEIYHPPYLFARDGSGQLASRPVITSHTPVRYGGSFAVDLGGSRTISQVVLVRSGSTTHSFDMDQRRVPLDFTQSGDTLTVSGPPNARIAPPGQYMLFAIDSNGVPSEASILRLNTVSAPSTTAVQAGDLTLANSDLGGRWITATFKRPFARRPVVVVGDASFNGSAPVHTRIRNVTTTGFQLRLEEWPYQDGSHTFETIGYVAAEPGRHRLGNMTIEAGAMTGADGRRRRRFSTPFDRAPVVLATVASTFSGRPVTTRISDVRRGDFSVRLQGQESDVTSGRLHGSETVHHIAFSLGSGWLAGQRLRAGRTSAQVTHQWRTIWFGASRPDGVLLSAMQSFKGSDTATLRYRDLRDRRAQVRVHEDMSRDRELRHGPEKAGWVVIGAR